MSIQKRSERSMFYKASASIFEKAKLLRNNMTEAEKILWQYLKHNNLNGFRFKAQHPIMGFIVDFYCHNKKLVIEIDGEYHQSMQQNEYDKNRTHEIERFNIRVIRFTNEQIKNDLDTVLIEIKKIVGVQGFPL